MLTDIFAFRYSGIKIWEGFGNPEQRLVVQAFSIVKEMHPYWDYKGNADPEGKAYWENLHDRIAIELGKKDLSQTSFSYQSMWQGKATTSTYVHTRQQVCENWMHQTPSPAEKADEFVKERLSLVEVAFRDTEASVARSRADLPRLIEQELRRPKQGIRLPGSRAEGLKARFRKIEETFHGRVDELNTRFRQAGCKLHYHNGFIQSSDDALFLKEAEQPFWQLVGDPRWKNVDTDMKEAIDRRDNGDRDPSWYAARALESTIKIISGEKGWTHGGEKGAHNYIDNLAKKDASYIEAWESVALKAIFTNIRNPLSHGPGSAEMPSLSGPQTELAIETCMSWIKSLIKRL